MLKKTIKYTDFNEEEVVEDHYFHLSQAELVELEMSHEGGLSESLKKIIAAEDGKSIIKEFKNIILSSYGKKSADGRRFIKTQEMRDEFESSEAYSTLFMELVTNPEAAIEFINGIVPSKLPAPIALKEEVVQTIPRTDLSAMSAEDKAALMPRIASGEVQIAD